MKNAGAWLFALIAGGYIVFELTTLQRLGYRMEVDYILDQMVSAEHAVARCFGATNAQQNRYEKRFASLQARAARELAQEQPDRTDTAIAQQFADATLAIRQRVDGSIEEQGCDGPELVVLKKRFEIYAGKSR